jgi:hypothetical protein
MCFGGKHSTATELSASTFDESCVTIFDEFLAKEDKTF